MFLFPLVRARTTRRDRRCSRLTAPIPRAHRRGRASSGYTAARPSELGDFAIAKAVDDVIVHHSDGLHVRIDDLRTDERKPAALQILAHRIGFVGARRDVPYSSPPIL